MSGCAFAIDFDENGVTLGRRCSGAHLVGVTVRTEQLFYCVCVLLYGSASREERVGSLASGMRASNESTGMNDGL